MRKKAYQKGRRTEYQVMEKLKEQGFLVDRSAGSRGYWDIIALSSNAIWLVQVKASERRKIESWKTETEEMELLQEMLPANCFQIFWIRRKKKDEVWWWDKIEKKWKLRE